MKLGVSACLIGTQCRYDGIGANDKFVIDVLQKYFQTVPYCPETIIWGSPREAIRQTLSEAGELKIVTSTKNPKDVTFELENISKECANKIQNDDLCGFILKSSSPTCGLERVKVYKPFNAPSVKNGVGVFAKQIKEKYPYLPVEEEGRLIDPWLRENFLMQIFAYQDLHNFIKSNPSFNDLVIFHTSYKYLIYSKAQKSYTTLGRIVANKEKKQLDEILLEYKEEFLKAISLKGNVNKTYNVLLHMFGYFKKLITKEEKEDILQALQEFKDKIIPLIAVMKIINLYVKRFDVQYLKVQKFLNPYPKELSLRSDIKAYK
ncbi:hypothetical protein CKA55_09645 [Arcobacter suis]|uniref:DUF523 and DUF1722 domain-containing protein n=1 Tax=Arcobacter suis CECT 7833 TaxID=663365 RepID=A0AAD0SRQ9_9BACT|nr:DUF523 and DUF1722 domain-containing protein [Arcobacter suis]AXX89673.1 DUF523 and DUF1722 domain-containing protein [Arcobacter suis CECT 7833]RWS45996.1 hypothetical protein CKA55_09645 [Arcobacter suis]